MTAIVDRLLEFRPDGLPTEVVWPAFEPELFTGEPPDPELRRRLGIDDGEAVLVYAGNAHPSNAAELRSLYLAVAALNRAGRRVKLVRLGRDYVRFVESRAQVDRAACRPRAAPAAVRGPAVHPARRRARPAGPAGRLQRLPAAVQAARVLRDRTAGRPAGDEPRPVPRGRRGVRAAPARRRARDRRGRRAAPRRRRAAGAARASRARVRRAQLQLVRERAEAARASTSACSGRAGRLPPRRERRARDGRALRRDASPAPRLRDRSRLLRLGRPSAARRDGEPRPEGRAAAVGAQGDRRQRSPGIAPARDRRRRAGRRRRCSRDSATTSRSSIRTTAATAGRPRSRRCRRRTRASGSSAGCSRATCRPTSGTTASTRSRCSSISGRRDRRACAPGSGASRATAAARSTRSTTSSAAPGDAEHLARLRRITSSLGIADAELDRVLAELADDPETYFLSAEGHNRWRGGAPYDGFPMRRCVSIQLCLPVDGLVA